MKSERRRQRRSSSTSIESLEDDILVTIFTFLDLFDLVRCSLVSKSWNSIIGTSKLLPLLMYRNHNLNLSTLDTHSFNLLLEDVAMDHHKSALVTGAVHVDQWPAHSTRVAQCRMKRGVILTGVGDKVVRLWSSQTYNCLEQYSLPPKSPLLDFDFDETKVVGLIGTRICIIRRHGGTTIFPKRQGMFPEGLCMRYMDPDAVVGCDDGTVRVFDMYSQCCSQIIRMHNSPVTCMTLGENQLIVSGSCLGSVTVSGLSSDGGVAKLKSIDRTGIKTLCYNPCSQLVFAGSTSGHAACWDLRKMRSVWEARLSTNVLYSMHHLQNDTSTLIVGGIDGVLRILDQNTGEVLSRYAMDAEGNQTLTSTRGLYVERKKVKRLAQDANIDNVPTTVRPPIKCLAVGMGKVVTTHNNKYIRVWRFEKK